MWFASGTFAAWAVVAGRNTAEARRNRVRRKKRGSLPADAGLNLAKE
jgi:hypothetical protein